jgi:hypothetical protein
VLRRGVLLAVVGAFVATPACGGDHDNGPAGGALAARLVAALERDGGTVDGDLDGAEVTCPDVEDPGSGDRATCVLRFGGGRVVDVDLEFDADGAFAVVAVVPR